MDAGPMEIFEGEGLVARATIHFFVIILKEEQNRNRQIYYHYAPSHTFGKFRRPYV